jgi:hypothetical protein
MKVTVVFDVDMETLEKVWHENSEDDFDPKAAISTELAWLGQSGISVDNVEINETNS